MKRQIQVRASAHSKNTHVIEHTPIYDLDAYQKRKKQLKYTLIRSRILETITFFCMISFTFSILFLGE